MARICYIFQAGYLIYLWTRLIFVKLGMTYEDPCFGEDIYPMQSCAEREERCSAVFLNAGPR